MSKYADYRALVNERKACRLCQIKYGMKNQSIISQGIHDEPVAIGAWSIWQGSLNAKILVVGQDWGDEASYIKDPRGYLTDNVTDFNLIKLLDSIGFEVPPPKEQLQNPDVFFTNTVLCMKQGGLAGKIPTKVYSNCAQNFLKPLIRIINPDILVTLGSNAYKQVMRIYGQKLADFSDLMNQIKKTPKPLQLKQCAELPSVIYLPAPQCGQFSTNRFINLDDQMIIWGSLKKCLA